MPIQAGMSSDGQAHSCQSQAPPPRGCSSNRRQSLSLMHKVRAGLVCPGAHGFLAQNPCQQQCGDLTEREPKQQRKHFPPFPTSVPASTLLGGCPSKWKPVCVGNGNHCHAIPFHPGQVLPAAKPLPGPCLREQVVGGFASAAKLQRAQMCGICNRVFFFFPRHKQNAACAAFKSMRFFGSHTSAKQDQRVRRKSSVTLSLPTSQLQGLARLAEGYVCLFACPGRAEPIYSGLTRWRAGLS